MCNRAGGVDDRMQARRDFVRNALTRQARVACSVGQLDVPVAAQDVASDVSNDSAECFCDKRARIDGLQFKHIRSIQQFLDGR